MHHILHKSIILKRDLKMVHSYWGIYYHVNRFKFWLFLSTKPFTVLYSYFREMKLNFWKMK